MKQLYDEALADVKKLKEVAEDNAKRAIMEAVTPRIKDFIEKSLLNESMDDDLVDDSTVADVAMSAVDSSNDPSAGAVTTPDEEGKVTVDLDALGTEELPNEFEVSLESVNALKPLISNSVTEQFRSRIKKFDETFKNMKSASAIIRESNGYNDKITQMISDLDDMYVYVQESVEDLAVKTSYEKMLESYFADLNKLSEQRKLKNMKTIMNEEDVTLKLTGLPDDVDLDSVGVDLITGDDEDDLGGDDLDMGNEEVGDDFSSDEEGDDDLGDLDLSGGDEDDQMSVGEGLNLSDDTIVEIDEKMLKAEILRMKKLREVDAKPAVGGKGVSADALDDFGGGEDEGDPLSESDLEEIGDERTRDDLGGSETSVPTKDKSNPSMHESIKGRLVFERKLQARAKSKLNSLKVEARDAQRQGNSKKVANLKVMYANVSKRLSESLARSEKFSRALNESARKESRSNSVSTQQAESNAVKMLRNKLAETNLFNAKLLYTNMVLQNESLSARQKAKVVEQLDEAKTVREAKLVYESLANTLAGTSKPLSESKSRKVLGSSSMVTRSSSTVTLNEGHDIDRWARLAGIANK
jgi:hypothetical protein